MQMLKLYWDSHIFLGQSGVQVNKSLAKEWFGKACDNGDQNGCEYYGKLNRGSSNANFTMRILECRARLFSSGRIQMGDAPAFHWVYGLQVPHHGSKPILVNKNKRLSIHSI